MSESQGRMLSVSRGASGPGVVGVTGFEPTTSWSRTKRSTKLSYTPRLRRSKPSVVHPVKQLIALAVVVVAACPQETPALPDSDCLLVRRPVDPQLVRVAPDGSAQRRPLLRPSCVAVGEHIVAWADGAGVHVEVEGHRIDVAADSSSLLGHGCLAGVALGHRCALIQQQAGVVVFDAAGVHAVRLPVLAPGEWLQSIDADGSFVVGAHGVPRSRRVDGEGRTLHRVYGPRSAVIGHTEPGALVLDDGRRLPLAGPEPDAAWGEGNAFIAVVGERRIALIGERVIELGGDGAWEDHGRILSSDGRGGVHALTAAGDQLLFQMPDDVDLLGQPLHRRLRSRLSWDPRTQLWLVSERLQDAHCRSWDNIVVIDADGRRRVIAAGTKARTNAVISDGVISFVEFDLSYEPCRASVDDG